MKQIQFTTDEIKTILWYVEPRLTTCAGVLTPEYTDQFLRPHHTQEQIDVVHAERRAELAHIEGIVAKLKGAK